MHPLNILTHPWLYEGPGIQIRTIIIVNSALFLRHPQYVFARRLSFNV